MNSPLQGGAKRRGRRRWPLLLGLAVLGVAAVVVLLAGSSGGDGGGADNPPAAVVHRSPKSASKKPRHPERLPRRPPPGISLSGPNLVAVHLKPKPGAALLFDVDTGKVLWKFHPMRVRPIASVTKVMTALLVTERLPVDATARITKKALRYTGSEVGVLPRDKRVRVETLLYGLLLVSGNDAAVALAERVAGSDRAFARMMNRRARKLGLSCTHYTSSYGLQDGNRSCPADLAALSRIAMREPRIARVVRHSRARVRFPFLKGGQLDLHSTNPLYGLKYPGTIGLKTGFTDPAGHCLVAIARRGDRTLGAVLLKSADTGGQARQLLDAGFSLAPAAG
ncbi:MAG TPA: serine hydrolase [Thermoleophilaceae bacterium]|jgi:D-alanyl-D-alanine carboxypeptidase